MTTEFYEIKPDTYMKSQRGDRQLQKYVERAGDGFVKGTEILDDVDGTVLNTNILSDNPLDFSGTITLHTDSENHPGMIFYSLDDGKTKEEKMQETVQKVVEIVVGAALIMMGAPAEIPAPTMPAPAPVIP